MKNNQYFEIHLISVFNNLKSYKDSSFILDSSKLVSIKKL